MIREGKWTTEREKEKLAWEMILGKNNEKAYKGMSLPEYTTTKSRQLSPTSFRINHGRDGTYRRDTSSNQSNLPLCFST